MDINIEKATFYMGGKRSQMSDSTIKIKCGEESSNGDLFHNANGELFFETTKIADVRKAGFLKQVKSIFSKRR